MSFEENSASRKGESPNSNFKGEWSGIKYYFFGIYSSLTNAVAKPQLGWDPWGKLQATRGQII